MSRQSTNTDTSFSKFTLEYIENDVFFKQPVKEVRKWADLAFLNLLRSDECDDQYVRNLVLDSWFANSKSLSVIEFKEVPDNILELTINFEIL